MKVRKIVDQRGFERWVVTTEGDDGPLFDWEGPYGGVGWTEDLDEAFKFGTELRASARVAELERKVEGLPLWEFAGEDDE